MTTGAKTSSSGNFFAGLAWLHVWGGGCETLWRFAHDPARHTLTARKPFVAAKVNISLKKGIPVQILWRKAGVEGPTALAAPVTKAPADSTAQQT